MTTEGLSTEGLPDAVVNQRLMATVYVTATGQREGSINVAVYMDDVHEGTVPFEAGWRGWDGEGLSDDEKRYVSAALLASATRLAEGLDDA